MVRHEPHWRLQKSDRFFVAAERALTNSDWETAISRAYYAAYHAVLAMLETKTDVAVPRRHATLHNLLASGRDGRLLQQATVTSFRQLFLRREVADYEDEQFDGIEATQWVESARLICSEARTVIGQE